MSADYSTLTVLENDFTDNWTDEDEAGGRSAQQVVSTGHGAPCTTPSAVLP